MNDLQKKLKCLQGTLSGFGKAAIAFSGGIDSRFLLTVASGVLGAENTLAVIVKSQYFTDSEIKGAASYAEEVGVPYEVLDFDVLSMPQLSNNPPDRCYICKQGIFRRVINAAKNFGAEAVLDGSNADDLNEDRPGRRAIKEIGIKSPLQECGFSKQEIRRLARDFGIKEWEMPSSPCLATRFPHGATITQDSLDMVEAAEAYLNRKGFTGIRVRTHGDLARIQVAPEEIPRFADQALREEVFNEFAEIGYRFVTIDVQGYK